MTAEVVLLPPLPKPSTPEDKAFQGLVQVMHRCAPQEISGTEARDAARNLLGLTRTVLAIERRMKDDAEYGQRL